MDGVLVDTEKARFEVVRASLAKRGFMLNDDDFKKFVGRRTRAVLDDLFGDKLTDVDKMEIGKEDMRPSTLILKNMSWRFPVLLRSLGNYQKHIPWPSLHLPGKRRSSLIWPRWA